MYFLLNDCSLIGAGPWRNFRDHDSDSPLASFGH